LARLFKVASEKVWNKPPKERRTAVRHKKVHLATLRKTDHEGVHESGVEAKNLLHLFHFSFPSWMDAAAVSPNSPLFSDTTPAAELGRNGGREREAGRLLLL
jgi:hypothetical protein